MFLSLLLTLLFLSATTVSAVSLPSHFTKSFHSSLHSNQPHPYFELTQPLLPFTHISPTCSYPILSHSFANTVNLPPLSLLYTPPLNCTFSDVILSLSASSKGEQYDRISAVWIEGVEILRTSTAEPNDDGIFWNVQKDVTKYESLLRQENLTFSVMLENVVNDVYTGVYDVNVTFLYYDRDDAVQLPRRKLEIQAQNEAVYTQNFLNRKLGFESEKLIQNPVTLHKSATDRVYNELKSLSLYQKPADLIIPVSADGEKGFWFRIDGESDIHCKEIQVPLNTYKAVIEIYVSFHGNDEFWYSNPPDSYIETNNLATTRGHGAYREILVTIDGTLVGTVVPFPVIFTGGINPLFWEPIVAIGAFDLPAYDLDITPFLDKVLDGKSHLIGLGVADSIDYWYLDANLHLWLDHELDSVQAKVVGYQKKEFSVQRSSKFEELDGSFEIEAKRQSRVSGWVNSSVGNLTTVVSEEYKFENLIKFEKNGTRKLVKQKVETKSEVRIESEEGNLIESLVVKRKYPLSVEISTLPGSGSGDDYTMITKVEHGLKQEKSNGNVLTSLSNSQQSGGWMVVKDHEVLLGTASTNQVYDYKDDFGCYSQRVSATNGEVVNDTMSVDCASSL